MQVSRALHELLSRLVDTRVHEELRRVDEHLAFVAEKHFKRAAVLVQVGFEASCYLGAFALELVLETA
jgi:hypothetical protein